MQHVMQAVGSMVMGLRPEKMMETDLTPRNLQTGATWKFPPVLLMAASNDQLEILELINNTQAALQTKVACLLPLICPLFLRGLLMCQLSPCSFTQKSICNGMERTAVQSRPLHMPKPYQLVPEFLTHYIIKTPRHSPVEWSLQ